MTANVLCKTGKHKYQMVGDDNPENRKDRHLECIHCGKVKELDMYGKTDGKYMAGGGVGLGG